MLLLDEPLGALDLKLRQEMQIELKTIQQEVGITFIYVTHDQEEALAMSDRMAIFNGGLIEQVGTPADVYEAPTTPFVAGFVGASNIIASETAMAILGRAGTFTVRPEKIHLGDPGDAGPRRPRLGDRDGARRRLSRVGHSISCVARRRGRAHRRQAERRHVIDGALALKGKPVRLTWHREHTLAVRAD